MIPYIWLGLHVLGSFIVFLLLFVVMQKENTEYKSELILAACCCAVAMVARSFAIMTDSAEALIALAKMESLGKCFVCYFALLFLLKWRHVSWPRWVLDSMFTVNCVFCGLIMLMNRNKLFYTSIRVVSSDRNLSGVALEMGKAPLYYVYMVFMVMEIVLFLTVYLLSLRWYKRYWRSEPVWIHVMMIVSAVSPILLSLVTVFDFIDGDDLWSLGLAISLTCWLIVVLAGGLFDTVKTAKENVINAMKEGVMVVDNNLNYLYSNPSADDIFWDAPKTTESIRKGIQGIIDAGEKVYIANGKEYKMEAEELREGKERKGYMILVMDITDVMEQNRVMRELKEEAESANRAKSLFISNMSHEIRTPMNAIVGMTEILLQEELPDKAREYLMNIRSSGDTLLAIINDILDISKVESGKMELVLDEYEPMSMLSDLSMIFLSRIGEKQLELIFDIDKNLPTKLYGDVVRVRQIITNLVNNAIKFTERGQVKLSVQIEQTGTDEILLHAIIQDTGQGIREEDMDRLFHSFQQLDTKRNRNVEGTGLGLSISKLLVERMEGSIEVESEYGRGSEFRVHIPQKVVTALPAARLNGMDSHMSEDGTGGEKTYQITGRMRSRYAEAALKKLTEDFEQMYVEYDKARQREEGVDYIFTDTDTYLSVRREMPEKIKGAKAFCVIQNPLQENVEIAGAIMVNSPLFSLNFCQILNQETMKKFAKIENGLNYTAPNAKILVVDDSSMNLKVAKGLLKATKIQIDTAENGKQAVDMIREIRYDLVLMDHMMPVMDGIEATRIIRQIEGDYYKNLPVIALTANAIVEERDSFLEAGMNDFIAKPIEIKDLYVKLAYWLPDELLQKKTK